MKYKLEISMELKDLIPLFKEETKKNIDLLKKAIEEKNFEQISTIAHKIKGSGGSYGFMKLSEIAKQIEFSSKNEKNIEQIKKQFEDLKDFFDNTEIIYVNKPLE